jgi:hypothetical protein
MINIVVPMAGNGSRFVKTGQIIPKPLIEVLHGKRMIEYVIDYATLPEPHRFIFVCLEDHHRAHDCFLKQSTNNYELIVSKNVTSGPAATALLAKELVDDSSELIIAYCDGFYTSGSGSFLDTVGNAALTARSSPIRQNHQWMAMRKLMVMAAFCAGRRRRLSAQPQRLASIILGRGETLLRLPAR